jgi:hypothetical protein
MHLFVVIVACLLWALPASARMTKAELTTATEACIAGTDWACEQRFLSTGYVAGSADIKSLLERLAKICDAGDLRSCTDHAAALMWTGDISDPQVYLDLTLGCVSGDGWGCYLLGRLQLLAPLVPEKGYLALHDARRDECKATGDAAICVDYAYLNEAVRGVVPDADIRWSGLLKACEKDESRACAQLSYLYGDERAAAKLQTLNPHFPVNHGYSAALARKACKLGNPVGCWNLGLSYQVGSGVPKDEASARNYIETACRLGLCYADNRSWLAAWLESQNIDPEVARPILRAIMGAVIGLVGYGLLNLWKRRSRRTSRARESGLIAPSFLLVTVTALVLCGLGIAVLGPWIKPSTDLIFYVGVVCLVLGLVSILGLLPAYDIIWDRRGIWGPTRLWINPFGRKKLFVAWAGVAHVGAARGGNYYLTDPTGHRIYWNLSYNGSGVFLSSIEHYRPDLFDQD